eukprot:141154_1
MAQNYQFFFGVPKWLSEIPNIIVEAVGTKYNLSIPIDILQTHLYPFLYIQPIESGAMYFGHCNQTYDIDPIYAERVEEILTAKHYAESHINKSSTGIINKVICTYAGMFLFNISKIDNHKNIINVNVTYIWPEWNAMAIGSGTIHKNGKIELIEEKYHPQSGSFEDLVLGGKYHLQLNINELLTGNINSKPLITGSVEIEMNGTQMEQDCIYFKKNEKYHGLSFDNIKALCPQLKKIPNRMYPWSR